MKKQTKKFILLSLGLSLLLILSGCVQQKNGTPTGEGWVYHFFVAPMENFITFFAKDMNLGFGMALILVTIVVRLLILPLGLYQSWKASYQAEKMAFLKPIFEPINQRLKNATSQEEKMAAQTDLMAAQRQNGVNPLGGIGCLPLLIQMPFFIGLYYAARFTSGISESSFLGFNLGKSSLILTIVIAILYFIQSWLSMHGVAEEQKAQMKTMMYAMPLMMFMMSINLPASVAIYWFVGGIFSIIQQLITTYILKPKLKDKIAAEFATNPPKAYQTNKQLKDVTAQTKQPVTTKAIQTPVRRNAGKQNRKK